MGNQWIKKNVIFRDISSTDPYYEYIYSLASKWFLTWYEDGTFRWENPITRSEFLKMICLVKNIPLSTDTRSYFLDVSSESWYKKYVNTGIQVWIVSKQNKYFWPNRYISRVEALKMILWVFVPDIPNEYTKKFLDIVGNEWYIKYVEYASNRNLLSFDTRFYPLKDITRREVIGILYFFRAFPIV